MPILIFAFGDLEMLHQPEARIGLRFTPLAFTVYGTATGNQSLLFELQYEYPVCVVEFGVLHDSRRVGIVWLRMRPLPRPSMASPHPQS